MKVMMWIAKRNAGVREKMLPYDADKLQKVSILIMCISSLQVLIHQSRRHK